MVSDRDVSTSAPLSALRSGRPADLAPWYGSGLVVDAVHDLDGAAR
jgi:hypothetical protein